MRSLVHAGFNVLIQSGSGSTSGPVNGLGNLVLGYDEPGTNNVVKSGSHNLVRGFTQMVVAFGPMHPRVIEAPFACPLTSPAHKINKMNMI